MNQNYEDSAVKKANSSSRSRGAIGANAVVPRAVRVLAAPRVDYKILDYGSGKDALHVKELKDEGFNVTAWEFGENFSHQVHDPHAIKRCIYDMVYASNVLNVQADKKMLMYTLREIAYVLRYGGTFVFNYPESPRYLTAKDGRMMSASDVCSFVTNVFGTAPVKVRIGQSSVFQVQLKAPGSR